MAEYLDIGRVKQQDVIFRLKQSGRLTWKKIWEALGVSRSMVFFYRSGRHRIPRDKFQKLIQLSKAKLDDSDFQYLTANYSLQKASIPQMCGDLAEFMGILYGDGCLGNHNFTVDISGDSRSDFLYHNLRVKSLFKTLFDIDGKFIFDKKVNEMHTRVNSKIVHQYLSEKFSFPIGHKKGRMHIPKIIYQEDENRKAFLRGLFDTDGGIHRHHNSSVQVQYTSYDSSFIQQIQDLYSYFGFNARINGTDIQIRGKDEIDRFFREICPANPKHQYKYNEFKRTGQVPLHREIDYAKLNSSFIDGIKV